MHQGTEFAKRATGIRENPGERFAFLRSSREACPAEPQLWRCRDPPERSCPLPVPHPDKVLLFVLQFLIFDSPSASSVAVWGGGGEEGEGLRSFTESDVPGPNLAQLFVPLLGRWSDGGAKGAGTQKARGARCTVRLHWLFGFRREKKACMTLLKKRGGLKCLGTFYIMTSPLASSALGESDWAALPASWFPDAGSVGAQLLRLLTQAGSLASENHIHPPSVFSPPPPPHPKSFSLSALLSIHHPFHLWNLNRAWEPASPSPMPSSPLWNPNPVYQGPGRPLPSHLV